MTDDEKDEDGLTEHERAYGSTPFGQMSPDDRLIAMAIREKRDNARYTANEEHRRKKEDERKASLPA